MIKTIIYVAVIWTTVSVLFGTVVWPRLAKRMDEVNQAE